MNINRSKGCSFLRGPLTGCILFVVLFGLSGCGDAPPPTEQRAADILIIGAGISGLSAAFETARAGRSVLIIDMLSVFGGHSLLSTGGLSIVDTPLQRKRGIADSPDLAFADFIAWGEDSNEQWVRYYVDHSSEEIYDWLTDLGAQFTVAVQPPGAPRSHRRRGEGAREGHREKGPARAVHFARDVYEKKIETAAVLGDCHETRQTR